MAWNDDEREEQFAGSVKQEVSDAQQKYDELVDLVSEHPKFAGKADPPWLIELTKTIRKALIGGAGGTDKKLLKTLVELGIDVEDTAKSSSQATKRVYTRSVGGIQPGSIIRFTYRHRPWRVAAGSKMSDEEIKNKIRIYEQLYNKHRQELKQLNDDLQRERMKAHLIGSRQQAIAVVKSYQFSIDLKIKEIKRDLRERRRYNSYLVPGALARIPKTWDHTRYRNVLVLNPRHDGKLHGIALDKLNPAQQEVLVRVFDPVEILRYDSGKYEYPKSAVERLTKDIFDRLGNPLLKVKDKQNFYIQFVKPLLNSYGDVYRQFFVNRMHGVINVSTGQGGIGPEQAKLSNVSQQDLPLFKRLQYMMKSDAPKDIKVNAGLRGKFKKLMSLMTSLLKISSIQKTEDDWEPWMGSKREAEEYKEDIKKKRMNDMKQIVKDRLGSAPTTPEIREAQSKLNKVWSRRWDHEFQMKVSFAAKKLGEMSRVVPEWTAQQKREWEKDIENAENSLRSAVNKSKGARTERVKIIKGKIGRRK